MCACVYACVCGSMDGYALMLWLMVRVEGEGEGVVVAVNANVDCAMGGSARLMQKFVNCNTL